MSILNNVKIGKRMTVGFALVMILGMCAMMAGIWGMGTANTSMRQILNEKKQSEMAWQIQKSIKRIVIQIAGIVIDPDISAKRALAEQLQEERKAYKAALESLKKNTSGEGLQLIEAAENTILAASKDSSKAIDLALKGKQKEALQIYLKKTQSSNVDIEKSINALLEWRQRQSELIEREATRSFHNMYIFLICFGLFSGLASVGLGLIFSRSITKPIEKATLHLEELGRGNFSQEVPREELERGDEFGRIAHAIHGLNTNVGQMIKCLGDDIHTLAESSTQLSSVAVQVSDGSRESSQKSETVAAAAEEMSTGMVSVAAGMEQAASSLSSVVTSTEEMTSTIGEIAQNSEKARSISLQGVSQTDKILSMVSELGRAAQDIGQVTETIMSISSQTNLLALNATIEAARAGSAGKGFAVVAGEIKDLAQQTAEATDDIKNKIAAIQSSTTGTITDIEQISQVIKDVNDIVTSIATAIEEQSVVTRDIAQNISQATIGVTEVNEHVSQSTSVVRGIAADIAGVNENSRDMYVASGRVEASSAELTTLTDRIKQMVAQFKV